MHSEPATREAQRSILDDVLRWALPTFAGMGLFTLVATLATGMFKAHWARGTPSLVLLAFCAASALAVRSGQPRRALLWLIAGMASVIVLALTFNGGLRAPAATLLVFLIALCGWVFGRTGANRMALISVAVTTLYFVLGVQGLLPEPPPLPLVGQYVMLLVLTAALWSTSAAPPQRLREALVAAAQRERELAEEQRRREESQLQFRAVFDQTSHLLCLVSPSGALMSANRAALEFAGLPSVEPLLGTPFAQAPWVPEAERAHLTARLARVATGSMERFELQLADVQGRLRTLDMSLSPFRDGAGALRYLIAEGRDITELVAAKERRAVTQRLELVGQLAGGVAHDFNNVLMVILTSAEVLRLDLAALGPPSAVVKDSLDTIAGAGHHASDLTRRLLSFGRRGVGLEKRAGSLHALIDTTTRLLQRTLPANVRVVCELRAESDLVHGDLAALESALFNVALNARDAMPAGGTLTFTTSRLELDAEACRQSGFDVAPGAYVRVSVRDTGTGIAPQHLGRLFEPFFTTKEEGRGTGLGLASVFAVLREHAGLVQVESQLGQGTTFHLTLPLSMQAPVQANAAAGLKRFDGRRALVVDDEAQLRKTLVRLLATLGFDCVQAGSAEEALPLYDEGFDVLVTDLVLPGRRGSALAAQLLERTPALRALLISGFPKDSELATLPAQRVRMLGKPFSFEQLQEALGALLPVRA